MSASTPVRSPDTGSPRLMTKRAWWLVVVGLLIPGSAQVLAGSRRLGRFGLATTLLLWAAIVVGVVVGLLNRSLLVSLVTNTVPLVILIAVVLFYAVVWVVLQLDTLRLVRFVKVTPSARGFIAGLAVVALVVTVSGAGFAAVNGASALGLLNTVFSGGQVADPINGRYNILLLGGDAGPDRTGLRPDSISVVSVDAATGSVTMFGIPRNMQRIPFVAGSPMLGPYPHGYDCGVDCLVSYLYTYGEAHPDLYPEAKAHGSSPGVEAMRDAVEGITGLTMQYYVLIDMQGFASLIDALGGIDINVTERLPIEGQTDANGQPINVSGWIEKGQQHMNGYIALWYARSRHGTSDYDRMSRQREVQTALLKQMDPANVLLKFQGIAAAGSQIVSTDIPQSMLAHFVDLAAKAKALPVTSIDFVPPDYDMIHPDFAKLRAQVAAAVAPTPTPTPGNSRPPSGSRSRSWRPSSWPASSRGRAIDSRNGWVESRDVGWMPPGRASAPTRRAAVYRSACSCQTFSAESRQLKACERSRPETCSRSRRASSSTTFRIASARRAGYPSASSRSTASPAPAEISTTAGASE